MTDWFKARLSSLGVRLLVPLFLVIAAVLAAHALITFRATKERFHEFVGVEADRSSGLIRRATHDGMLLNRLDEVQSTIERLAEGSRIAAIRVYDKQGAVVLSSLPREIGRQVPLEITPCQSCHSGELQTGARVEASELIRAADQEVLRQLSVIENEPGCTVSGCHDQDVGASVLGVLEVEMSMEPLDAALSSARMQLIWTTMVLMLVIGSVTTIIVRTLIYRPIGLLQDGARRIAGGDLSTRIEVPRVHELALLARDFNHMAEDLDRMQSELTEWSHKLEHKVIEKTSELRAVQGQVLHMEKMASLGKLSATVAHEINNPISGILTYSRLIERELADEPLDPERYEELERYLHLVQRECVRCGKIVQNLLSFARRTVTDLESTDLNEVVERSLMLVGHHLEISGVRLRTEMLESDASIVADPGQLQQALVALFMNAVEAMPEGGELSVQLRGDANNVEIEVRDTGVGIEPEALSHVFEPFFSTKLNESGAGLGLAVVYGIIHRHGGEIDIESTPGVGTDVQVRLPRTAPAHAEGDREADTVPRPLANAPES
ncbi:MAG: ATP-binding protein [Gemmatimonadota bacterium]